MRRCGSIEGLWGAALAFLLLALSGCSGVQTYPAMARAGDTVAVAAGRRLDFGRDKITVTITASTGATIVYPPGDPAVRAVVNLYPDPLSSILVSPEVGEDLTPYARTYADLVDFNFTQGDRDWWQTAVFVDLPDTLPVGVATIDISSTSGETASAQFTVVSGIGQPEDFEAELNGPLNPAQLASLERVASYEVSFTGSTVPHAIQVDMIHDPDAANGGTGKAWVVNPRGDLKNLLWNDDGTSLRVLATPAGNRAPASLKEFRFYVTGISGLLVQGVKAVDAAGNPVAGISAQLQYRP